MTDATLAGYAIVFPPARSLPIGGLWIEEIDPAAVDMNQLEADDMRVLAEHDSAKPLGRLSAGNVKLVKDRRGLHVTLTSLPDTSYARDVRAVITKGITRGMSFSFLQISDIWRWEHEMPVRTVTAMKVREVSFGVTWPAFPDTERSLYRPGLSRSGCSHDDDDGRAWARRLARMMRLLATKYPRRDVRLYGDYTGSELRWDWSFGPRAAYRPSVALLRRRLRLAELA